MADDTKDTKDLTELEKAKIRAEKRASSSSDLPGFDKELERLKEERIKFQKKNKTEEIKIEKESTRNDYGRIMDKHLFFFSIQRRHLKIVKVRNFVTSPI